jgi:GntR family transcriptional regulator
VFIELRKDDPRPVYRQIADELQRAVTVGVLKPGEGLPATRVLAKDLKLNPNTVQHAYRTLLQEGVIEMRRGLGAFVAAAAAPKRQPAVLARQIAERALREAFRHGLLGSDLLRALQEIAPGQLRSQLHNSATPNPQGMPKTQRPKPRS